MAPMGAENIAITRNQDLQDITPAKPNPRRNPKSLSGSAQDESSLPSLTHLSEKVTNRPSKFTSWISNENSILIRDFIADYQLSTSIIASTIINDGPMVEGTEIDPAMPIRRSTFIKNRPTSRQLELLHGVAAGFTNVKIATELGISDQTVKNHLTALMRKFKLNDRSSLVLHGITQGMVEPLLISAEADFSGYIELSSKERQVYELLTGLESNSNREIGNKLYISEQTVKNHITEVLRRTGTSSRSELALFEAKRQERILTGSKDSFDLTTIENQVMGLVSIEPSFNSAFLPDLGIISEERTGMKTIYRKLGVSNYVECAAAALLYEFGPEFTFAPPEVQEVITEHLCPEQKALLIKAGSFNDKTTLRHRASLMGMDSENLKQQLSEISDEAVKANVYRDIKSPFVYQAMVILKLNQLKAAKEKIEERQKHLRTLATDRSTTVFEI